MKLLPFIFMVSLSFNSKAQDNHHELESLFHNKSVENFERILGMMPSHYQDGSLCATIDAAYRNFYDSIQGQVLSGNSVSENDIDRAFQALIEKWKPTLNFAKPLPPSPNPLPMPESADYCESLGFETGNFTGWQLTRGSTLGGPPFSYTGEYGVAPGPYHSIQGAGIDPLTGISTLNPTGGSYSVMLGNSTGTGAQGARLKYSFVVDANTTLFEYSYAVIFQSPTSHNSNVLPYFTVRIYDGFGDTINCGNYSVYADQTTANDYEIVPGITGVTLFKDWETVITNLTAYMGQSVTIEFTAGDCGLGAHYGYAYVDASCGFSAITATLDTICPGEPTTLTAPSGVAGYNWSNGSTTQSITVTNGGTYACELIPFQAGSCSFYLDYTIVEKIAPVAEYVASIDSICINESIGFIDQSTIASPLVITDYQWNFGNGISTPAGVGVISGVSNTTGDYTNLTHLFSTSGVFPVELTVTASNGCENSFLDTILTDALPIVVAGPDQTICGPSTITLSGTGAANYSWDQGVLNGVPFIQAEGITETYTVTGTSALGCVNSDQVTIETLIVPIVDAGLDQTICFGEFVVLAGTGAPSYVWDNGIFNNVTFVPSIGSLNYTVIGTNANGCESSDQVIVTVLSLPAVDAGLDQSVCDETPIILNGSGSNNPIWNNGVFAGVSFLQSVGTTTYILYDTLTTGCYNSDSVTIVVMPNPEVTASDSVICFGESVVLSGEGAVSYAWTGGITDGLLFYPNATNSYTVLGTAANGCQDSETILVTVHPNPVANFQVIDSLLTTINPVTTFTNFTTGATTYEWYFGDGSAVSTEFEPVHNFPYEYSGFYEIMLIGISSEGCVDTSYQSAAVAQEQTIYVPNTFTPDGDDFNEVFLPIMQGFDENEYTLYIYNRWGELIFESHDLSIGWDGTYVGQDFKVQDGVYTWKIIAGLKDSSESKVYLGHITILK